jgi:hypothetical protein
MEVSPRGGGNRLSEMLRYSTGVDMISNAVRAAIGDPVDELNMPSYNGYWAEIILHADKDGVFEEIIIDDNLLEINIREVDMWVNRGHRVNTFRGANDAIGTLVARFETKNEMIAFINNQSNSIKIIVE